VVVVDPIAVAAEEHRTGLEVDTADSALEGVVRSLVEDLVDIVAADRRVGPDTAAVRSHPVVGCMPWRILVLVGLGTMG
jgi:hypothetical protein